MYLVFFLQTQMSPTIFLTLPFSPLFFLLFSIAPLSSLLPTSVSADHDYLQNCQPKSCGNLTNVSFPFWFQKLQPNYCGFPAFELRCESDTPKLSMPEEDYHVRNISYDERTVTVSMARFASMESCYLPYYNLSFSLTPFTVSSLNRELVFVYNCSSVKPGSAMINCQNNSSYANLGGTYQMEESDGLFGSCYSIVMPVVSSPDLEVNKYRELLAGGFLLNWTAPDCSECMTSNGQCGYNYDTRNFMCICPDRAHLKSCSERSSKTARTIGLSTAGGLSFIIFCLLCFLLYRHWKKKQFARSNLLDRNNSHMISDFGYEHCSSFTSPIFSYDELYEATNGFDASKELGDGGFGTVYKGMLKDGRVVAVKRLYENNYRRLEQFMNEVKILSLLRHQNLVTLYGCTSRRSRELLLVYEFVPNGTVADHLHGSLSSESLLPWKVRLSIAIETADALNYLHSIEPQIIHRDVKTTNILLDSSFHVKVADFGLSRLFPLDATHVSTAPQGTAGYVDPEYYQCYQLTDKSDVYSFGVVLMELISSMAAVDISRERNEVNLSNLAIRKIQQQELDEFVDRRLGYDSDHRIKGMISEVAGVGLRCLHSEGDVRPAIKEVLEILRGIEKSGWNGEDSVKDDVRAKEEAKLLKCVSPCSPDSVTERWKSASSSMISFTALSLSL